MGPDVELRLQAEACALGAAASLNLRQSAEMTTILERGVELVPDSPDVHLVSAITAIGKYLHVVRQRSNDLDHLVRPPLFVHDASHILDTLRALAARTDSLGLTPPTLDV